jgi:hypothetical protein
MDKAALLFWSKRYTTSHTSRSLTISQLAHCGLTVSPRSKKLTAIFRLNAPDLLRDQLPWTAFPRIGWLSGARYVAEGGLRLASGRHIWAVRISEHLASSSAADGRENELRNISLCPRSNPSRTRAISHRVLFFVPAL